MNSKQTENISGIAAKDYEEVKQLLTCILSFTGLFFCKNHKYSKLKEKITCQVMILDFKFNNDKMQNTLS